MPKKQKWEVSATINGTPQKYLVNDTLPSLMLRLSKYLSDVKQPKTNKNGELSAKGRSTQ